MKQTNLKLLSVVIHIPIFFALAMIFLLFLAGCRLIEFEQSEISATATSTATNLIPNNQSLHGVETHRIDIYGSILNGYEDVLNEEILPQETLVAMVWEMATIESEATLVAMPIPTDDPDLDLDSFAATAESFNATAIAIMDLTYTPQPTYAPLMGILYAPAEDALPLSPRFAIYPNSAWRGYVNGQNVFLQIGRVNNAKGERVGFIDLRSSNNSGFYESPTLLGNTLTFRLIDVISDQYLVIEIYEEGLLSEWYWTGGTGEIYYFDMVAREFISQPTAELQISNFPPQAEATPTPPIVATIPPIQPQHPHQP